MHPAALAARKRRLPNGRYPPHSEEHNIDHKNALKTIAKRHIPKTLLFIERNERFRCFQKMPLAAVKLTILSKSNVLAVKTNIFSTPFFDLNFSIFTQKANDFAFEAMDFLKLL